MGKAPKTGGMIFTCLADGAGFNPALLQLPTPHFVCLLDWDADAVSDAQIDALARQLLDAGAVMMCCHGEGSLRIRERFAAVAEGRAGDVAWRGVAWLEVSVRVCPDDVREAVAFVLDEACPAPRYLPQCGAVLALVLNPDILRLAMLEMAIAMHLLRGPEPHGPSGAACAHG